MTRGVKQREKAALVGTDIDVAVPAAGANSSPHAGAGERKTSSVVQGFASTSATTAQPRRHSHPANDARPPAPHPSLATVRSGERHTASNIAPKGVSSTRTKASVTRPRKKPALETPALASDPLQQASKAIAADNATGSDAKASPSTAISTTLSTGSRRRTNGPGRKRGSGALGLPGRVRLPEWQALLALPDALVSALPTLRQAILDHPLDEAITLIADELASALAPAATRIWLADAAPWSASASRVGGSGIAPGLHLRARSFASERFASERFASERFASERFASERGWLAAEPARVAAGSESAASDSLASDPLLAEVTNARRPSVLFDAVGHPLARAWVERTGHLGEALPALGTLAAYPLLARGQFLGVLAIGTASRLSARQLAALEELADLLALSADRDRLLSYSRSSEALAQTVVQHAPVAMALITGPEHTLALANPAFAQLLGLEGETALAGKRLADVIPQRARTVAVSLRLDAAYAGDEPQAMVELPMHRESRVTYWNVTTSPVPGVTKGGALVAAVEVTRQVMARWRAQESAEVAEQRLRQMMSLHAASLAVASQLDADPRALLADLLRRSISLLGALAGTIYVRDPGRDILDVVVSEGLRRDYSGCRLDAGQGLAGQVARARQGLVVDDYRLSPYGAGIYLDEAVSALIAVPLIHHNEVVGVLEVLDDGERRTFSDADLWLLELFAAQAAQAIQNARMYVELERAYRKQRELDHLKDDFIATASHELRTPLTGVQGFLELLLDLPAAQADPLLHTFAQKAASAAEELTEITERLLQTSRLDTGRMDLHTAPVQLAPLVAGVLATFRELRAARAGGHELVALVDGAACVIADPARLKEILDNLVSNAIKYSPRGGRVTVACEPFGAFACRGLDDPDVGHEPQSAGLQEEAIAERPTVILSSLTATPDADSPTQPRQQVLVAAETQPYCLLTVADQGIGIPHAEQARLFGRFARLDGARVSQIRGTGLGLYICRQLARSMGGDAWLQRSQPGEGSVFAVALPAALDMPANASQAVPSKG